MIELENVCKSYRISKRSGGLKSASKSFFHREYEDIHALSNVSFRVNDGEMVGYIGPNGAGKSSSVKIMSGILTPDSGKCFINGRVPWLERKAHTAHIGVVFGQRSQLWWDVPVIDSFELLRDIYRVDALIYRRNLDELTELLSLSELLKTPTRQLSLGQRMRCEIAASLLHSPDILFLDEPTIGLDALSKLSVRSFIKKMNREHGTTVILTTHDMQDIEALTERIILIGKGKILQDGSLDALKRKHEGSKIISVDYSGGSFEPPSWATLLEIREGHLTISLDTEKQSPSAAIACLSSTLDITDISVSGISTEQMVISMYRELRI